MSGKRTPLFVRLPRGQAAALDQLADATGRQKQDLVSELLADRLNPPPGPLPLGRLELSAPPARVGDEVLTLREAATLLKLPLDIVRLRAEEGDLPGRRFGTEWRFARGAVLDWLAGGEVSGRRAAKRGG